MCGCIAPGFRFAVDGSEWLELVRLLSLVELCANVGDGRVVVFKILVGVVDAGTCDAAIFLLVLFDC